MTPGVPPPDLDALLPRFGLREFRPGQREVIQTVLAGQDCLCVMPTGGGKSLCYQLPALALDGLTLVVSPLIALMKDQVDQLEARCIPVTFINSTLSLDEQYARLDRMAAGEYRLVYVVPERFRSTRFLEAVGRVGLALLAVDEAHCISEWGHDFRPDYARLGHFRRRLNNPPTIALTATATDAVRRDIIEQLDLHQPRTFITGFARHNLFYEVLSPRGERQKAEMLVDLVRNTPGPGIVYAATRKKTEEVASLIAENTRRRATAYHAGLLPEPRRQAQEAFMEGRVDVVVATTAFGMGIDKRDVRFVIHYNLPGSLEAYYQEAGRAGRDGQPSRCTLLYSAQDRYIQEFFIDSAYPSPDTVAQVYDFLRTLPDDVIELTQQQLKERLGVQISNEGVGTCEQLLEGVGVLERLVAAQNLATVRIDSDLPTLVDLLPRQARVRRQVLAAVERLIGSRRDELVPFAMRDLLAGLDLDQESVTNALRELNNLQAFTYIPPFRGRAIRMLQRDVPFEDLEIDFEELDKRKAAEYEKLNRVVRFALGSQCRQQEILRYFGDHAPGRCGHCDNCRHLPAAMTAAAPAVDGPVLQTVRMALSGVARTQSGRFPCGKNLVAQMLCGSGSAKLQKLGFHKLSTFGLLKHLGQQEVATLLDGLIASGHVEQVEIDAHRPVVKLTEAGQQVMSGKAPFAGSLPVPPGLLLKLGASAQVLQQAARGDGATDPQPAAAETPAATAADLDLTPDPHLVAALKRWRAGQASVEGLPAFRVCSNATIDDLARRRPQSLAALREVHGIGEQKVRQYGEKLLQVLAGSDSAAEVPPTPAVPPPPNPEPAFPDDPFLGLDDAEELHDGAAWESFETASPTRPAKSPPPAPPAAPPAAAAAAAIAAPSAAEAKSEFELPPRAETRPYYWTWRVLAAGFDADACAAIRQLKREQVLDHALQAAEDGWPIEVNRCLSPALVAALRQLIGPQPPTLIRPLLEHLPPGTSYAEVQLYVKCARPSKPT